MGWAHYVLLAADAIEPRNATELAERARRSSPGIVLPTTLTTRRAEALRPQKGFERANAESPEQVNT